MKQQQEITGCQEDGTDFEELGRRHQGEYDVYCRTLQTLEYYIKNKMKFQKVNKIVCAFSPVTLPIYHFFGYLCCYLGASFGGHITLKLCEVTEESVIETNRRDNEVCMCSKRMWRKTKRAWE